MAAVVVVKEGWGGDLGVFSNRYIYKSTYAEELRGWVSEFLVPGGSLRTLRVPRV